MLYTEKEIARELAAQLKHTDLGITAARTHTLDTALDPSAPYPTKTFVIFRLDNGQEFSAQIDRWGGPRA